MSKIRTKSRSRNERLLVPSDPFTPVIRPASTTFAVTGYSYIIHTQGHPDYLVFDGEMLKVRGVIDCVGDGHHAYVIALADESLFPLNRYYPSDKTVWIFCRVEQFPWHIDMLRNERPVYCVASTDGGCSLTTGTEPVGEGES